MASIPPAETPMPTSDPVSPGGAPAEIDMPGGDSDIPDPSPAGDPGTGQPAEF